MLYMVTFTINIPPMLVYIPYMDPMGIDFHLYRVTQLKTRTSVSVLSFVDICCFLHHVFIGQNLSFPHPVGTWMHMVFKPFISCRILCILMSEELTTAIARSCSVSGVRGLKS